MTRRELLLLSQIAPAEHVAKAIRLARTLDALRRPMTIREACAANPDLCEKSIRRDLITLRRLGYRLTSMAEAHGRKKWKIERKRK